MSNKRNHPIDEDLSELRQDAIGKMRSSRSIEKAFGEAENSRKYRTLATIVCFVGMIKSNEKLRNDFLNQLPFKFRHRGPSGINLCHIATRFVYGADDTQSALYEQARVHSDVVSYYDEKNIEPHDVYDDLMTKTIYGVIRIIKDEAVSDETDDDEKLDARSRPKESGVKNFVHYENNPLNPSDELDPSNFKVDTIDKDDECLNSSRGKDGPKTNDQSKTQGLRQFRSELRKRRYPFDDVRELAIEAVDCFDRLLSMRINEEASATIQRLPDDDGWPKFKIIEVETLIPIK